MNTVNKNITVAVTGAEGFLGNNICRKLIVSGYKVKGLCYADPKAIEGLDMEIIQGDITKPQTLVPLIKGADVVIHCAGSLVMDDSYETLSKPNIDGVRNVVNACIEHDVKRLIHGTSIQVFEQEPKNEVLTESRGYVSDKACDYDRSKADGDRIVIEARQKGLDTLVMVIGGMLGPNDFKPTVSGKFLIDYHTEKKPVPSKGGYDWVDVRDVAEAIVKAIDRGGKNETYILNGKFYSMIELCTIIEEVIGRPVIKSKISVGFIRAILPILSFISKVTGKPPVFTKARLDSLFINAQISHEKAQKELDYNPRPIKTTLTHAYKWFEAKGMLSK